MLKNLVYHTIADRKLTNKNTRLCSESANLCQCQNFNQKRSGIPLRIAKLIHIWIRMPAVSPKIT